MSRLLVAQRALTVPGWAKDALWRRAQAIPSLDLRFADNKSLVDATTGSNLVTFTRASSGTYVGSDGVLQTAVTNLLLQSEDFSTTWANTESTEASNVETAPNGTLTADKLIPDVGVTSGQFRQDVSKAATATTYTCSVYGKAAEFNRLSIRVEHNGSTGNRADVGFSLSDGSVVSAAAALGTFSGASATVTSVGAGWYRFTLSFTSSTETSIRVRLFGFDSSLPCNGTSGIYIWGAQLEQSATVGEYIPTTSTINSAPRFDHNPTTGESLGLLVEEQRTNLLLRSEEFGTTWTATRSSVSANAAIAPDGAITADKLIEDTSNNTHLISQVSSGGATTSAVSFSIYVKSAERSSLFVSFSNAASWVGGGGAGVIFDLSAGTASPLASTPTAFSITPLINGWYRCHITATPSVSVTPQINIFLRASSSTTYTGDGTSGLFLWGAQLEAGAFPTSYIPTTTAAATRSADVASITGSAFSGWYRQDEGTVFAEAQIATNRSFSGTFRHLMQASPAGNSNSAVGLFVSSINQFSLQIRNNATNQAVINTGTNSGLTHRVAGVYKVDDFALSANGGSAAVDTLGTAPSTETVTQMAIGGVRDGNTFGVFNGTIRRLTYWPQRLANSTLQQITQ